MAEKEYIEREAAISYIKDNQCKRCSDIGLCGKCAVLTAVKLFESIPAADVRPVVLCKDCVYSSSWYRDKRLCILWNEDGIDVFEDGFCNYGTKSDNEKQQKSKVDYLVCLTKMQTNICPNCGADMREES